MNKCLITRPNHDKVTSYLFNWSKKIIKQDFGIQFLNLEGKNANKNKVESYLKKQNPRLVLFNGHGNNDIICGFKDEIIIQLNKNDDLLKGKIIYSLSCSSAKRLGENAVKKGADAFIGYKEPFVIYTDTERETTPLKDNIASSFLNPSNTLSLSLLKGSSAKESSKKSKAKYKKEIKKYFTGNAMPGSERIAAALLWDMNNQVVLGNEKAKIIIS